MYIFFFSIFSGEFLYLLGAFCLVAEHGNYVICVFIVRVCPGIAVCKLATRSEWNLWDARTYAL